MPVANPGGPYSIVAGSSLALDGSASFDPDGSINFYTWDVNGDGVYGDATGATPTVPWPVMAGLLPGEHAIRLRVRDNFFSLSNAAITTFEILENLPPLIDLNGTSTGGTGYSALWTGGSAVSITNSSAAILYDDYSSLTSLTATIIGPQDGDILTANTAGTPLSTTFSGTTLTVLGTATLDQYQQVLRTLKYHNTSGGPGFGPVSIEVRTHDILQSSNVAQVSVTIDVIPEIDLNGPPAGIDYSTTWTNSGSVLVASPSATLAVNYSISTQMFVQLAQILPGAVLSADTSGTNLSASFSGSFMLITGFDTAAHWQQVLRTISYNNSVANPGIPAQVVWLLIETSPIATATIALNPRPTVDLNGAAAGSDYNTTWSAPSGAHRRPVAGHRGQ